MKILVIALLLAISCYLAAAGKPTSVCSLKPEAGPCRAYKPRYFYNSTSYECERFVYGGCSGNENRFRTKSKCQDTCQNCPVEGAVFTLCASPCPASCSDTGDRACITLCVPGCACLNGEVIDVDSNRCVPREDCPQKTCSVKGQRFYDVREGECVPCTGTCAEPNPVCTKDCRSGCACPSGTVLNDEGTECIHPRTCPRKCMYNGQTYEPGDKWNCTESDECMFCWCLSNGHVAKHTIGCPEKESCRLPNGSEIAHGESFHAGGPCVVCTCDDGDLSCDIEECPKPDCENPIVKSGECCLVCRECSVKGQRFYDASNGECVPCTGTCAEPNPVCTKDCRSGCACPSGTVLNDNGTECIHPRTCPRKCEYNNEIYLPGDKWNCSTGDECKFCVCLAIGYVFEHTTGCPKDSCKLPNGTEIPNNAVIQTSPCITCTCDKGDLVCAIKDCIKPNCANPVVEPGECCPVCPRSCTLKNGTSIPDGSTFKSDPCTTCTCEDGRLSCFSVTCAPVPKQCENNYYIPPGQCCPVCRPETPCQVLCDEPRCRFPSVVVPPGPGQCCPTCGCVHNGQLYRVGQGFSDSCNLCGCQEGGIVRCTQRHCL